MAHFQTLRRLSLFTEIADAGSLRAASARLNLSTPVLSTALSELEAELGTTLINRTTRKMVLTPAGEAVLAEAQAMRFHADRAIEVVGNTNEVTGSLSITAPAELAGSWLPDRLKSFQHENPAITIRLEASDQTVDMKTGTFDVALRTRFIPPGKKAFLKNDCIDILDLELVARPPVSMPGPDGKLAIPVLRTLQGDSEQKIAARNRETNKMRILRAKGGFAVSSKETACRLAEKGFGAALLMRSTVETQYQQGRLVPVLPNHDFGHVAIHLIMRDTYPTAAARAFALFLKSFTNGS